MIFDPIADMLTRIRNAINVKHTSVEMPSSTIKKAIADILVEEGYVTSVAVDEKDGKRTLKIELKYTQSGHSVIQGIKKISKPGLRIYAGCDELPRVINGLGIAIVSTSQGVMTDKKARKANIGGEVLAYVW